ncbi:phosphatidate cytidylyltransferase [Aerococcaceae bacterium DSM 111176]|nr:phosphatidate cytidylyltransferase [Aerococcaceae bacterium DSM 111176]
MKERWIYGFIALFVFLPFAIIGGVWFSYFLLILGLVGLYELLSMANITEKFPYLMGGIALFAQLVPNQYLPEFLAGFETSNIYFFSAVALLIFTVFKPHKFDFTQASIVILATMYIGRGFNLIAEIRGIGFPTLVYFLMAVWVTDIFALLVGSRIGKTKLAPQVSPNKTVEGMLGGVVGAVLTTSIYMLFFDVELGGWIQMTILTIIISLTGQFGDLVESAYKRHFDVKDSGTLIPGHGGILDRLDSTLFASLVFGIWLNLLTI